MAKEQQLFGYTKEQVNQLQAYLLDKPAKEAIPLLNIIGAGIGVTVTIQEEQPKEDGNSEFLEKLVVAMDDSKKKSAKKPKDKANVG